MTDTPPDVPVRVVKPFADWLAQQRSGDAATEWAEALAELVESVELVNKKGSVTFTVLVNPSKGGSVIVADDITIRPPKPDLEASLFFYDDSHNLVREDPRQQKFTGMRDVSAPEPTTVKDPTAKAAGDED